MSSEKRIAVLCVHGIQGNPAQFDWIEAFLSAQYTVKKLLLPGHGGDVRAFQKSGMAQWQQSVDEAIRRLSADHDSILFIGHSMGCLLGIDACIRQVGKVHALALLACPLSLHPTWRYLRNNYFAAAGRHLDDAFVAAARAANGVQASSPLAYISCIRPYLHLLLKIRAVRRALPRLRTPVSAFHSAQDEIVSSKSLDFLKKLPDSLCCTVPGCGHYLYTQSARDLILRSLHAQLSKF